MDATTSPKGSGLDLGMYLQRLEADAALLAGAAANAGPDAAIPTCPEWTMRDLLLHIGEVHRWATTVVANGVGHPRELPAEFLGPMPDDDHVLDWFDTGWRALAETLRSAPADLQCWTFLTDPPPPTVFWARRQTFETAMHRVDAESAVGPVTPFLSTYAADGIDEILTGFVPRKHMTLRSDVPKTLGVALIDDAHAWHLTISEAPVATVREARPADCEIRGRASDVYLALWNRQALDQLTIEGDPAVIEMFRDKIRISWT